jgi:hypothetical protein
MQFDPQQITSAMQPVGDYARSLYGDLSKDIAGRFGTIGAGRSSALPQALAKEARNLSLGINAQFAPMQYQGYQSALGRQMQMPGQIANIGALQRGIPAESQAFELSRYMQQDPARSPYMSLGLQAAGIPTQENIAFQGYRQPSMLESVLPAMGQMVGAAGQAGGFGNLFRW